jgi:Lrp/AsnC family leucine-responsive transcriptional regulator
MKDLKSIDYEIFAELVKNPRLSDRQLAKILNLSQPTITRRRGELERRGLLDYTAILDIRKLGFEILAITFGRLKSEKPNDKEVEPSEDFLLRHPEMVLVSSGSGLGYDRVVLSVHRTYSEFSQFITELRQQWGKHLADPESFIISLQSDKILRDFTLKQLAKAISMLKKEP